MAEESELDNRNAAQALSLHHLKSATHASAWLASAPAWLPSGLIQVIKSNVMEGIWSALCLFSMAQQIR